MYLVGNVASLGLHPDMGEQRNRCIIATTLYSLGECKPCTYHTFVTQIHFRSIDAGPAWMCSCKYSILHYHSDDTTSVINLGGP